jgi:transcriptional regulator with XRE-family HTH domain
MIFTISKVFSVTIEHQPLINFLEQEADKRGLNLTELAERLGISPSHLYTIRNGKQPGLKVCLDIARALKVRPDYILFLAGHITEDELDAPQQIPAELLPTIQKLSRMRGTPFFDTAMRLVEDVIDKVVHLWDVAA